MIISVSSFLAAGCSQGGPRHGNGQGVYQEGKGVGTVDEPNFNFSNIAEDHEFEIGEIEGKFDFNSSQLDSEATFDFGEGGGSDSREKLPTPSKSDEQASKYLREAREKLLDAIKIYASFGGVDYDITTVSPATDSFSLSRIQSKIRQTQTPLLKASRSATEGQKVLILALEQVGIFLKHAARSEVALQNALSEYHTAIDYLEDGDTTNVGSATGRLNKQLSKAEEHRDLIKSESDSTSMQIIGPNAQEMYEAKMSQIDTLTGSFTSLVDAIVEIRDGLSELKEGVDLYTNRQYDNAEFQLGLAASSLQIGHSTIQNVRSDGVLQDATISSQQFSNILYRISDDLHQSAKAKLDHDDDAYTKYREQAIEHLKSDDRTRYMQEINRIQW